MYTSNPRPAATPGASLTVGPITPIRSLLSPGAAIVLLLAGYTTAALYLNYAVSAGATAGGASIRLGLLLVSLFSFFLYVRDSRAKILIYFVPLIVFSIAYSLRYLDNTTTQSLAIDPPFYEAMLVFWLAGLLPGLLLAKTSHAVQDRDFAFVIILLSVLFVGGIALNFDAVRASAVSRLSVEKANPISLSYAALTLLTAYAFFAFRSRATLIVAIVLSVALILVVIYARSRGPMVATAGAILIFALLSQGQRRMQVLAGATLVGAVALILLGAEQIEIVQQLLGRTSLYYDQSNLAHFTARIGAIEQFMADPVFGRYVIELRTFFYPHNLYLESLMSVGLIGSAPLVAHFALSARATIGLLRTPAQSAGVLFLCLIFIREGIAAGISGSVWGSSSLWILSCVMIGLWYGRSQIAPPRRA